VTEAVIVQAPNRNVYALIALVGAELAREGIAKDRSNVTQGYKFRGIEDIFNHLGPLLHKHGLVIIPRITSRDVTERQTVKGSTLFYVTLAADFEFVSAQDGSSTVVRTYGEAMDSGDKATNKAMSAAYKYAALMTFAIPTEGGDTESTTLLEIAAPVAPPKGFEDWFTDMVAGASDGVTALKEAWGKSRQEYRDWAEAHHKAEWTLAKKASAKADKDRKAAK